MEVAMGGASSFNMDGDWESICGILLMDQDFNFSNRLDHYPHQHPHPHPSSDDNQGLLNLLMEDTNDSIFTSPFAQYYTQQAIPSLNTTPQLMSCNTTTSLDDLSNLISYEVVNSFHDDDDDDDDDQVFELPIIKGSDTHRPTTKRTCDHLRTRSNQVLPPKKKACVAKNVGKGNGKTQPPKSIIREAKVEEKEEDRKSSCYEFNVIEESSIMESNDKKRAMRGCATDPQSLYARRRRDRINERLKILQNLVPNGTKVDISTMLEDALHYVKFMQLQIKLLSSDEMWMYAPLAYHGFDVAHHNRFW